MDSFAIFGESGGRMMPAEQARLEATLRLLWGAHQGRTWPGSALSSLLHPLEVGCRVAAWGGSEGEILSAFLHDLPEAMGMDPALEAARQIWPELALDLADLWGSGLLPQEGGLPGPPPEALEGISAKILACDVLTHLRSALTDWTALAFAWAEPPLTPHPPGHGRRSPFRGLRRVPCREPDSTLWGFDFLWEKRALGARLATIVGLRRVLLAAYRAWMALPEPPDPPPFPVLQEAACGWSHREAWTRVLEAWGLVPLAREASWLGDRLNRQIQAAREGFLRAHLWDPRTATPAFVGEVLRKMNLRELSLVLAQPEYHAFRAGVPPRLQQRCAEVDPPLRGHWEVEPMMARIAEGLVAEDAWTFAPRLLEESQVPFATAAELPPGALQVLLGLIRERGDETWPGTEIPRIFHALEAWTLVLAAGGDPTEAQIALYRPFLVGAERTLPAEVADPPRAAPSPHAWGGPDGEAPVLTESPVPARLAALCELLSILRFLAADYAASDPVGGLALRDRRQELFASLPLFRVMLLGHPDREVLEACLVQARLGSSKEELADSLWPRDPLGFREGVPGELRQLQLLLVLPLFQGPPSPEVYGHLGNAAIEELLRCLDDKVLVSAGADPGWAKALETFLERMTPRKAERIREEVGWATGRGVLTPKHLAEAKQAQAEIGRVYHALHESGVF